MARINIRERGVLRLQRRFNRMAKSLRNRRPMFTRIGISVMNDISNNFTDEAHQGDPWRRLSQTTIDARRRSGGPIRPKILQDSGDLRKSFTRAGGNPKVTNNEVKVGSNVPYAPKHEFGDAGPPRIPRRQILPSELRGLQIATREITITIRRAIAGAGL